MLAVHTRAFFRRAIYSQEIAFLPRSNCIFIFALSHSREIRPDLLRIDRTYRLPCDSPTERSLFSPPRNPRQRSTRHACRRFSTRFPRRSTGRVLIKIARNRRRFRRCSFYAFHLFRSSEATSPRFTGRGFRRQFKKRRLSRAWTKFAIEREPCQP